jgi:hypothetical protein
MTLFLDLFTAAGCLVIAGIIIRALWGLLQVHRAASFLARLAEGEGP